MQLKAWRSFRFSRFCDSLRQTHPSRALEDIEDLLLSDGLVGGLWVGLGCWSEDGVDIGID